MYIGKAIFKEREVWAKKEKRVPGRCNILYDNYGFR